MRQRLTIRIDPGLVKLLTIAFEEDALEAPLPHLDEIALSRGQGLLNAVNAPTIDLDRALLDHPTGVGARRDEAGLLQHQPHWPGRATARHGLARRRPNTARQHDLFDVRGLVALLMYTNEVHLGRLRRALVVVLSGDDAGEALLGVHWMPGPEGSGIRLWDAREQVEVAPHHLVRDRHELAEDVFRLLVDADIVSVTLGHFLDAVEPLEKRDRQ